MRSWLVLWLLFLTTPLSAMLVKRGAVERQLANAVLVADIFVERLENFPDSRFHARYESQTRVTKIHRIRPDGGWFPQVGDRLTITGIGGEWNHIGFMIPGFPRPYTSRRYRAYLKREGTSTFSIAGYDHGLRPIDSVRDYSRNRTDGINGAGTGPFLYWDPSSFPIPYSISQPTFLTHPDFVAAIETSFQQWRDPADVKVELIGLGCSNSTSVANDGVNLVIFLTQNWPYDPDVIALTQNFFIGGNESQGGRILDTDILINGANQIFSTTSIPGTFDVQDILTHEAGHFIGMGHETGTIDANATMYAIAAPNETIKRYLHPDDLAGLHAAYGGVSANKTSYNVVHCVIPEKTLGCGAVHGRKSNFADLVLILVLFVLQIGLTLFVGRRIVV